VRDHNGQALSYIYYESEPGRRAAAKLLTKDEARRIAANIAKKTPAKLIFGIAALAAATRLELRPAELLAMLPGAQ
jgi:hypothetical protein